MVFDDLTQYKVDTAENIEVGDVLVNLGKVTTIDQGNECVQISWASPGSFGSKVFHLNRRLVREAREHEIEHDFDHNIDHGGEG